jgi:hypothetical protein
MAEGMADVRYNSRTSSSGDGKNASRADQIYHRPETKVGRSEVVHPLTKSVGLRLRRAKIWLKKNARVFLSHDSTRAKRAAEKTHLSIFPDKTNTIFSRPLEMLSRVARERSGLMMRAIPAWRVAAHGMLRSIVFVVVGWIRKI